MSDIAIRVESVSKRYRLGERAPYRMLREVLTRSIHAQFRTLASRFGGRNPSFTDPKHDGHLWALKDVSLEVRKGEVLGIIGNNGAGKSTLLKILSRITIPTLGRVQMHGRLASLLEVGTGFHPELTGRENIFLNGAILGMKRDEIQTKFDEIVSFAEVNKFLDTPVKHYSSGMYLRLAFAVAAHLEPEILLVDEVLAVGDMTFQKKCLGKMDEVARQGRTVLFVSHNLQAISHLTRRCLLLREGRLMFDGPTNEALQEYRESELPGIRKVAYYQAQPGIQHNHLAWVKIQTSGESGLHRWGEPATFEFCLEVTQPMDGLCLSFYLVNELRQQVCHFWMFDSDKLRSVGPQTFSLRCHVPKLRLFMGSYTITTWLSDRRGDTIIESLEGICPFEVAMEDIHRPQYDWKPDDCVYLEDAQWEVMELSYSSDDDRRRS